jgi:hypothetical protein
MCRFRGKKILMFFFFPVDLLFQSFRISMNLIVFILPNIPCMSWRKLWLE